MDRHKEGATLDSTNKGCSQAVLEAVSSNKKLLSSSGMESACKEGSKVRRYTSVASYDTAVSGPESPQPGLHSTPATTASSLGESRPAHGPARTRTSVHGSTASIPVTSSVPASNPPATIEATINPVVAAAAVEQTAAPADLADNAPATASTATQLKRNFAVAMGQNPSGTMRVLAEHDPENREIKRLRQHEKLKWGEIATILNQKRVAAGKVPSLTDNAVYSRYARNGPRIAAADGEVWDPSSIGPHVNRKAEPMAPIVGFDAGEDQLLVRAYQEIQQETWELVSERIVVMGGRKHDPEICARRYQAI
ncbi:hypothetical protein LPUS_09705 [Lasallia pustulata]|uniref:Myb-like domain-containing protein n=1 Tax=Lasallia pustulata TaxID=136370 RepID=A0A1W5D7W9_9LECA|nr:hypothetical protein LPUS_09705 [Lasallia pustulata]